MHSWLIKRVGMIDSSVVKKNCVLLILETYKLELYHYIDAVAGPRTIPKADDPLKGLVPVPESSTFSFSEQGQVILTVDGKSVEQGKMVYTATKPSMVNGNWWTEPVSSQHNWDELWKLIIQCNLGNLKWIDGSCFSDYQWKQCHARPQIIEFVWIYLGAHFLHAGLFIQLCWSVLC